MDAGVPKTWGPSLWRAIHFVALGYPSEPTGSDVAAYGDFFRSLGAVIPCDTCKNNYVRHLAELPPDPYLASGSLFEWTVAMHNVVNRETGKRDADWTVERSYAALLHGASAASSNHPSRSSQPSVVGVGGIGGGVGGGGVGGIGGGDNSWMLTVVIALTTLGVLVTIAVLMVARRYKGRQ